MECFSAIGTVSICISTEEELIGVLVAILWFCCEEFRCVYICCLICNLLGLLDVLNQNGMCLRVETWCLFLGSFCDAQIEEIFAATDRVAWAEVSVGECFGGLFRRGSLEAVELRDL